MNQSSEVRVHSSKSTAKTFRMYITNSISKLNLFSNDPFWSSTSTDSEQIITTRLFILFMLISLLITLIYSSLILVTHHRTLYQFTIDDYEQLENHYPSTINALCSEASIPYNKFLYLSPIFHQVCSSPFIEDKWISSLFLLNATSHNVLDYRTFAFAQYRALGLLCNISRQAVKDTYRRFNSTNLNNHQVFSRKQFIDISSVLFNNIQQNILANERQTGNIISMMIAHNQLWSALRTNYYMTSVPGSQFYLIHTRKYLKYNQRVNVTCDCKAQGNQCVYSAGAFYNWTLPEFEMPAKDDPPPLFHIPGLMAGCIPLDSMRQSTLECLYNQRCVNKISLQPHISQPKALNNSLTRFPLNSTIAFLFDESLFVESWQNTWSFENYFSVCAPQSLSYSYQQRFDRRTILTLTVSAFSGFIIVWKLTTPIFVKMFYSLKRKKQQEQRQLSPSVEEVPMMPKTINKVVALYTHRTIKNFNLFSSDNKNDIEKERIGIIITRLYILLICISLVILCFYTSLSEREQIITVQSPSISSFEELHMKYSSILKCPCSSFSMSYNRIISVSIRYHTICSSEYLKDYWLSYFLNNDLPFMSTDFRSGGASFFNLMKVLCKISKETINNAITAFLRNRLITLDTLSYEQFSIEIQSRLEFFQQQTVSSFIHLIQLIQSTIQTNQLAEDMLNNLGFSVNYNNVTSKWSLRFKSRNFFTNSCSCLLSNECTRPFGFSYEQSNRTFIKPDITLPGLVLGCYTMNSLLLSTLECFYDKKCIKVLINNYDLSVVGLVPPLDDRVKQIPPLSNNNSRFLPNTTINEIFSQLFVEEWINQSNFTSYYRRCNPSKCTYPIRKRFHIAEILVIMLGFCGGLCSILDIILPPIVKLIIRQWRKRTHYVNTVTTGKRI